MVGLSGVLGSSQADAEPLGDALCRFGTESITEYSDKDIKVHAAYHSASERTQPARATTKDVLLWVWGEIYGFDGPEGYTTRNAVAENHSNAAYCADLYDEYGLDFVRRLNGGFAGILYDRTAGTVSLFTDRLGSRPIYYARGSDGSIVFSSNLQSVAMYSTVETAFELEYLLEFFGIERVLGVKTPLRGIESVHPGGLLTFDLNDGTADQTVYWRPTYEPTAMSYSELVDEFVDTFRRAVAERTAAQEDYGILLSGGSDSRLIAGMMERDFTAYHMNDSMNEEAAVAQRVAKELDVPFELLVRDENYQEVTLNRASMVSHYSNWFDQAHALGFSETFRAEQDVLLVGMYADTFFRGDFVPRRSITFPFRGWRFDFPISKPVDSIDDFAALCAAGHFERCTGLPEYIHADSTLESSISKNISTSGDLIISHGVEYPSLSELVFCQYYPLSADNAFLMHQSLLQMMPVRNPYLDNRLIDLSLQIPMRYLLRRNVVNAAIRRINPELARIPHGSSGIPIKYPAVVHHCTSYLKEAKEDLLPTDPNPGPWTNIASVIRKTEFTRKKINENEELIRRCPFLDYKAIHSCYDAHLDGQDNTMQLYALLTFLEDPITKQLLSNESRGALSR